jgi:hypothetical protein
LKGKETYSFAFENGKEVVWWDENPATGHVIMTKPNTPQRLGYNRHSTKKPAEIRRLHRKMFEQETDAGQKFVEKLWGRGRPYYEKLRSRLTQRMLASDCSNLEKDIIRESLRLMDERQQSELNSTRYGVSAMEESAAPLEGPRTRVN